MTKKSPGFTLIEIMIVLVILGLSLTLGVSKLTNRGNELRAVLRKTTVLSRELHTRAKLNGVTYRLVIDLGDGGPNAAQSLWVEKANSATVVKASEVNEVMEAPKSGEDVPKSEFERDTALLKQPMKVPTGTYIREVELNRAKQPAVRGKTYIHYLPQGLVEEAAIHLESIKNNKQKWTISIHPLTGRAEVLSPSMKLQELQDQ